MTISLDRIYLGLFYAFKGGIIVAKITTTELVNKILRFCEAYSGIELFPYQAQFGKRIIRSVLRMMGTR